VNMLGGLAFWWFFLGGAVVAGRQEGGGVLVNFTNFSTIFPLEIPGLRVWSIRFGHMSHCN
jgi:hypothetical protein